MNLDEPILKTISYFDLFDYPLTRAEVWKYLLGEKRSLAAVDAALASLSSGGRLAEKNGLVFFPGRESIVSLRAARYRHACRKWRRAERFARIFSALPGVILVGIGNTLSYNNPKDGSDIDFFIIAAAGTLWRTRLIAAAIAAVCRLRPRPGDNRDKLCLSFFVSEENLNLQKLALPSGTDIYLAYWVAQMSPLCGTVGSYEAFRSENAWVDVLLPNAHGRHAVRSNGGIWRYLFWPLAFLPGDFLRQAQKRRFPVALRAAMDRADGGVVVGDEILKFHLNDRRAEIRERWQKRCAEVIGK